MTIEELYQQFFEHLRYERNVSEHTLRNYMSDLLQFLDHIAPADAQGGRATAPDIGQIDHLTIREWLSSLHSAQKKKTSVARKLAALRTFFQFLVREGMVENNPAKLVATPRLEKKLPNHLSIEDAVRFLETPDIQTDLGKRDRAILEMLYGTGVRVSELTKLDVNDICIQKQTNPRHRQTPQTTRPALWRTRAIRRPGVRYRHTPEILK